MLTRAYNWLIYHKIDNKYIYATIGLIYFPLFFCIGRRLGLYEKPIDIFSYWGTLFTTFALFITLIEIYLVKGLYKSIKASIITLDNVLNISDIVGLIDDISNEIDREDVNSEVVGLLITQVQNFYGDIESGELINPESAVRKNYEQLGSHKRHITIKCRNNEHLSPAKLREIHVFLDRFKGVLINKKNELKNYL